MPRQHTPGTDGDRKSEQRGESRYPTNGKARVRSLNPITEKLVPAKVLDISKRGMKLFIASAHFSPGSSLHIVLNKTFFVGEVRYCRAMESGFEHGIRIDNFADLETEWDLAK